MSLQIDENVVAAAFLVLLTSDPLANIVAILTFYHDSKLSCPNKPRDIQSKPDSSAEANLFMSSCTTMPTPDWSS